MVDENIDEPNDSFGLHNGPLWAKDQGKVGSKWEIILDKNNAQVSIAFTDPKEVVIQITEGVLDPKKHSTVMFQDRPIENPRTRNIRNKNHKISGKIGITWCGKKI